MDGDTWTARELADRLAPSGSEADRALAMRRIQHWTAEELILPVERYTGRGRVRRYPRAELLDAALLWEMAERQMSAERMRATMAGIWFSHEDLDLHHRFFVALEGSRRVLVLVNMSKSLEGKRAADLDPPDATIPSDWEVGLWIDLTAIFARLRPYFPPG